VKLTGFLSRGRAGDYADATQEEKRGPRTRMAITWGYNKDHRPDLKQLLYILTVARDGAVPLYFQVASGNVALVAMAVMVLVPWLTAVASPPGVIVAT